MDENKAQNKPDFFAEAYEAVNLIKTKLRASSARQVQSKIIKDSAKSLVLLYFRKMRTEFKLHDIQTKELDNIMQKLLLLSNKYSLKSKYVNYITKISSLLNKFEAEREYNKSEKRENTSLDNFTVSSIETIILDTLKSLKPELAVSYKQVIIDIFSNHRISYRGTAAELREVLREVLDHLSPDIKVEKQKNFKYEKGLNKPTMKQKARFILKSRGFSINEIKTPEQAISIIENSIDGVAGLVRSTYTKGSIQTHDSRGVQKSDIMQYKMYVDSVLCELLEIHSQEV